MHRPKRGRPGRRGDTVIVTGTSTGLGLESALHLADHGFRVFATVRDPGSREEVLKAAASKESLAVADKSHTTTNAEIVNEEAAGGEVTKEATAPRETGTFKVTKVREEMRVRLPESSICSLRREKPIRSNTSISEPSLSVLSSWRACLETALPPP